MDRKREGGMDGISRRLVYMLSRKDAAVGPLGEVAKVRILAHQYPATPRDLGSLSVTCFAQMK